MRMEASKPENPALPVDELLMRRAISLAEEAGCCGEVPVGCVIADKTGRIIGSGRNRREQNHDATAHAEIEAIRSACASTGDWRLDECSLYVTLEPCPMCMGAIINSRIPRIVFALRDRESGSCGSVIDLLSENYHHKAAVFSGCLERESAELLKNFFKAQRQSQKPE